MKYLYKLIKKDGRVYLKEDRELELVIDENEYYDEEDCIDLLNMNFYMDELESEESYCIAFDYYYRLLGVLKIAEGNYKQTETYRNKIGMFLLLIGARRFRVYHNHPDDELMWSDGDMTNWLELIKLSKIIQIEEEGSYIIAPSGWRKVGEQETHTFTTYFT